MNGTLSFFGSPEGRVVKKGTAVEYQYAISDHQGNTRIVFTSATNTPTANETSFETPSASFEREDVLLSTMTEMKRTGTTSQRLIGGYNSQVGATMSLKVYPGDKVKAEVYAKYRNSSSNPGNLTQFAAALTGAFGLSSGGSGEALNAYNGMNAFGALAAGAARPDDDDASPKGFITIMLFDKNRNFLDAAWDQLDGAYVQTGTEDNDPFDHLMREMNVEEEGYAYIFISNENATQVDIHFDDLKVTHTPTNVIQYNEYYPFGLSASTSWTRDNNKNDFLYNAGSELNRNSVWYDLPCRSYDAILGRFHQIDPLAALDDAKSPFAYAGDNPIFYNDPMGLQSSANGYTEGQLNAIHRLSDRNDPYYMNCWYEDFAGYADAHGWRDGGTHITNRRTIEQIINQFKNGGAVLFSFNEYGRVSDIGLFDLELIEPPPVYADLNSSAEIVLTNSPDEVNYYTFDRIGFAPLDHEDGKYSAQIIATYAMTFTLRTYHAPRLNDKFEIIGKQPRLEISAVSWVSGKAAAVVPSAKVSLAIPNQIGFGDPKTLSVQKSKYIRGDGNYTYVGEATLDLYDHNYYNVRLQGTWTIQYDSVNRFIPTTLPYGFIPIKIDEVVRIKGR